MSFDLDARLDAIFNAQAERLAEAKRVNLEIKRKQEENLQNFLVLQDSIIRPTLQALSENLTRREQECGIFESTDGQKEGSKTLAAATGIKFFSHKYFKNMASIKHAYLNVMLDKEEGKVLIQFNTNSELREGTSGTAAVDFDALTPELINEEALKVIAAINR